MLIIFLLSTIGVIANSYHCRMATPMSKSCCKTDDKGCCEKNSRLLRINDQYLVPTIKVALNTVKALTLAVSPCILPVQHKQLLLANFDSDRTACYPPPDLLLLKQSFLI